MVTLFAAARGTSGVTTAIDGIRDGGNRKLNRRTAVASQPESPTAESIR
jgi:hypothetical protein